MRRVTIPAVLVVLMLAAAAPAATGIAVTLPARVKGDLELLGEKHRIDFAIPAPGLLTIKLKGKSGVTPALGLLDPDGAPVDTTGFLTTSRRKIKVKKLPVASEGTWTVHVSDAGTATGRYKLTLEYRRADDFEGTGTVAPADTYAELTFRAEPGDVAKIKLKRVSGDAIPRVFVLLAPDAVAVDLAGAKVRERSKKQQIKKLALTQSGDYLVRVTGSLVTSGDVSIDISLSFDTPSKMKVHYDGDDFGDLSSTVATAHIDLDERSDYRLVVYDAATRQRLDLPDPSLKFESDGTRIVRTPGDVEILAFLIARNFSPPADGSSLIVDGVNVFDEAQESGISASAGLLRLDVPNPTVSPNPVRGLFVSRSAHHSVFETYELIRFCLEENTGTVFYPGSWPTQGNGTLPGRDGGTDAGDVSPHVDAAGALAVFASSLHAHGIDLVLSYDDTGWLATPADAAARAAEIAAYNAAAGDGEEVDGALVALDFSPTPTTGANLCDLLRSFATTLTNANTLAGTFPEFEALEVTWSSQPRPLAEQCLRAGDGLVHHVRRTEFDGPDSITEVLRPLTEFADSLGFEGTVWAALDNTDRTAVGGDPAESFHGRTRTEYVEALTRVEAEFGPPASSAGPVILDWDGFTTLQD